MTSAVYRAGDKATAIADITAAINARIATIADGSKDLDRESLKAWLRAEFQAMYPGEATSLSYINAIDIDALVMNLSNSIAAIRKRPDYPYEVSDGTAVGSLARMQAEARVLSAELTALYANTPREVGDIIAQYLIDENIQDKMPDATTREIRDRAYVVTYVSDRSEESAPSPIATLVEVDQNDTCTVARPEPPAGRNIVAWRVYRSADGNARADFELVKNPASELGFPIATTSITDALKDSELQEVCPTWNWLEPPADLVHVKAGPDGINAGHTKNTWYASVPYHPYAWLVGKGRTTDFPIVNHAWVDQSCVVLTQGRPYMVSGTDPETMSMRKLDFLQACASADSVVEITGGVAYASPDGICIIDAAGNGKVLTEGLFSKEQWLAMTPSSIKAVEHEGSYLFTYTGGGGGAYSLHLPSLRLQNRSLSGSAFHRDMLTDALYMASGATIVQVFGSGSKKTGKWRTKRAILNTTGFVWLQVESTFEQPVTVRIYADDPDTGAIGLWHTVTVNDDTPVILPDGIHSKWEVEVESSAKEVSRVLLATSVRELQR